MAGRGPQTFKKRQKEQQRKERQQEKIAKRLQRKAERGSLPDQDEIDNLKSSLNSESEDGPELPRA